MRPSGELHTLPAPAGDGSGWRNEVNGRVLSRHKEREVAAAAGEAIARQMKLSHVVHESDGSVAERDGVRVAGDMAVGPGEQ